MRVHTTVFLAGALVITVQVSAQNVGIGVPTPTQKLDVQGTARLRTLSSTDWQIVYADPNGVLQISGVPAGRQAWMVYGNAGLTAGTHFLGTTDAVALDFRTNNTIRFRIPATAARLLAFQDGTAAAPTYSWDADPNTGIYHSAADQLSFSTAGIERMRVTSYGSVEVNPVVTLPLFPDNFRLGVRMTGTDEYGIVAYSDVTHGTGNWAAPVYVEVGGNSDAKTGIQVMYAGSGTDPVALTAGLNAVAALTGDELAASFVDQSSATNTNRAMGVWSYWLDYSTGVIYLAEDAGGVAWEIGYYDALGTYHKIVGSGSASTIVKDTAGRWVIMNAPETPEVLFMDYGVATLSEGRAVVHIDPNLAKNIHVSESHPMKVFVQLEGTSAKDCGYAYVVEKDKTYFKVETQYPCNATFSWMIVANRADEYIPNKGWARYSEARFVPYRKNVQVKLREANTFSNERGE